MLVTKMKPDLIDLAYSRQQLRLAIEEGRTHGSKRPRRWIARWGGMTHTGIICSELSGKFLAERKRIAALVPEIKVSAEWF